MHNRTLREIVEGQTVISALADTSVRAAAIAMANSKVGAIVVVDKEGQLAGLFTERDVLNRVVAKGLDPDKTPLSAVMTSQLQVAAPDKPLSYQGVDLMNFLRNQYPILVDNSQGIHNP